MTTAGKKNQMASHESVKPQKTGEKTTKKEE